MRCFLQVTKSLLAVVLVSVNSAAVGEIIGYSVSGEITTNNDMDGFFPTIALGDPFTGSFKYDTSTTGQESGPPGLDVYRFEHPSPFLGVSFAVNGQVFQGDAASVGGYVPLNFNDLFSFGIHRDTLSFEQVAAPPVGFPSGEMDIRVEFSAVVTGGRDPITDPTALPDSVVLEDWDDRTVVFKIARENESDARIVGTIDSLQPVRLGDLTGDGLLTAADIDALSAVILVGGGDPLLDLDHNGVIDDDDRVAWVNNDNYANTYFGDANLDGQFDSSDLVQVFAAGEYQDGVMMNSGWATGDWDGDGEFTSGDIVAAFQGGGYDVGPRPVQAMNVPEPQALALMFAFVGPLLAMHRTWR